MSDEKKKGRKHGSKSVYGQEFWDEKPEVKIDRPVYGQEFEREN